MSRSTGFTLFKLLYRDKAITLEARIFSIRTIALTDDEDSPKISKDTIEGIRLQAIDNINKYKQRLLNGEIGRSD